MSHQVSRYHDISVGHRVVGHETKCKYLHGHNYRVHFFCEGYAKTIGAALDRQKNGGLDEVGRVIDFSVIKDRLCMWLERAWDHKTLLWSKDPLLKLMDEKVLPHTMSLGIVEVPFNPTAENMAEFLVRTVGPAVLGTTDVRLVKVVIEETRKCSASFEL